MSIRVVDLHKRHPGAESPVLRGVSMEVQKGAVAGVMGKSGAGKTTLLRCLVGLDTFDEGHVEIEGVTARAGERTLLGKVGLVFQSFELFPHMTVLENVALAPVRTRGARRADAEKKARALLDDLGLDDKHHAYPDALSGGQRQRAAIARALAVEPRVLLYDEPTSALDPSMKGEVERTIARVAKTGVTQVVVTHDAELAARVSDVVFVLESGRVARSEALRRALVG